MTKEMNTEIQNAFIADDFDKMKVLLKKGANVNSVDCRDGSPILLRAVVKNDTGMIEFLISRGVNVDKMGPKGMTPLHCAAEKNFLESARLLLEAGADFRIESNNGAMPLAYAVAYAFGHQEEGRIDVAKLLISHGAKKEDKNSKGRSLLDIDLYKEVLSAI